MRRISIEDVKTIVAIVGREGAISALSNSRQISSRDIADVANSLGLKVSSKDTKAKIATQIVNCTVHSVVFKEEIIQYFEQVECDQDELIELLSTIDLRSRAKSRRATLEFAAIQISSLGIFERLADRHR